MRRFILFLFLGLVYEICKNEEKTGRAKRK